MSARRCMSSPWSSRVCPSANCMEQAAEECGEEIESRPGKGKRRWGPPRVATRINCYSNVQQLVEECAVLTDDYAELFCIALVPQPGLETVLVLGELAHDLVDQLVGAPHGLRGVVHEAGLHLAPALTEAVHRVLGEELLVGGPLTCDSAGFGGGACHRDGL